MGRNEGSLSIASNVEVDDTPDLSPIEINLSQDCFAPLEVEVESIGNIEHDIPELSDATYDGLQNLAGFICKKVKEPTSFITSHSTSGSFTWIDHLSEGGLQKPTEHFMAEIEKLEAIFDTVNKPDLFISKDYLKNLFHRSLEVDCSESVKKLFFKCRMYFRIRELNKTLLDKSKSRKKKMKRIVT